MMATVDRTKPYIWIERASEKTFAIHLMMPDSKEAGVFIARTDDNATAIDYFHDKLKDGLNI
jgi:hypothetical protein